MSYPEIRSERGREPDSGSLLKKSSPELGSKSLPGRSRTRIEERLNRLGVELSRSETAIDSEQVEHMLLLLSADIRSGSSELAHSDYRWIVERLTFIYAQGFDRRADDIFTITADSYAHLIETISREYPGYDYSEAVGQLFCYMSRLFRTRRTRWKAVYEHILSIPDAVEAKQVLNQAFFVEIQEWAEAGVENLFSIRKDLREKIGAIKSKIRLIDLRIDRISNKQYVAVEFESTMLGSNVVDLAAARRKRSIELLRLKRQQLVEENEHEETVVGLIESDIREFEDKLRATRRAYFIRPV
jgi:hypothetical protein